MEGQVDKINGFFCGVKFRQIKNKIKSRCENNVIFGIFNLQQ
jgi:hypothetical protein